MPTHNAIPSAERAKSDPPQSSDVPRKAKRRKFRFTIDVALRREGMDESEYAREFRRYFDIVTGKRENKGEGGKPIDLKVFFEVLKAWVRHLLERTDLANSDESVEPPTVIQLRHSVPRPDRAARRPPKRQMH